MNDSKINNYKFDIDIIKYNKYNINDDFKSSRYFNSDSFSSFFSNRNSTSTQTNQQSTQVQGRTYNSTGMWSPESYAGIIYEWDRGVIGISRDGTVVKEKLDDTPNHHADATVRIASTIGTPIDDTTKPFEAAINCANLGTLIFQSEGDNGMVYFPENISEEQIMALVGILRPRSTFNFSFTHNEQIFEDVDFSTVLHYALQIKGVVNVARI